MVLKLPSCTETVNEARPHALGVKVTVDPLTFTEPPTAPAVVYDGLLV